MSKPASKNPSVVEIQVHPGTVRWGVRYLFLTRRHILGLGVTGSLLVVIVLFGLIVFPGVIAGLLRARDYRSLLTERELQGERVQALSLELESLRTEGEELRSRIERIYLTYGMSADDSLGQGGYPFDRGKEIDSIYGAAVDHGRRVESELDEQLVVLDVFISEIESFEVAHVDQTMTTPSISPLEPESFVLTSPFGTRRSPFTKKIDLHPGLDMAAKSGTEIMAPADGVVVFSGRYPSRQSVAWWRYGNLVAIRHGDLFITLFGHCEEILVRNGQEVSQGEVIATVGNSGWSTSPHLHYEVRLRREEGRFTPVDPRVYILDHRWRDQEQLLIRARRAPDLSAYEPLPRLIRR